ncbi:MAG: hypothetical protein IJP99_10665 [Methanobrevibacter sp.]|nr:hypothetical protein [Methanobrevibacter sp.]MBR0059780.1 hypothetical protein [Methanobrevibacter sp.]
MGKYKNIAEQLKKKTSSNKKSSSDDIYSCNYCPSSHHRLCKHQDKCILNKEIADILINIKKISKKIYKLREQESEQEQINRLILERKRLFRKYYIIETVAGGY